MKFFLKRIFLAIGIISLIIIGGGEAYSMTISFDPAATTQYVGDTFDVNVTVSGLTGYHIGAFDFTVGFDETIIGYNGYTFGSGLGNLVSGPFTGEALDWSTGHNGAGAVHLAEMSLLGDLSFQPDSFTLATLSFTAIGAGSSSLLLSNVILSGAWGEGLEAVINSGHVTVRATPIPSPLILFGTGLAGLIGYRRKGRKNR